MNLDMRDNSKLGLGTLLGSSSGFNSGYAHGQGTLLGFEVSIKWTILG